MATTKFNQLITDSARVLKTPRILATTDVQPYTSALLTLYANKSIRDFLIEKFVGLGPERFAKMFPEYMKESAPLSNTGTIIKPADAMIVVGVRSSVTSAIEYFPVPENMIQGVSTGNNRLIVPSISKPLYWEQNGVIVTLGNNADTVIVRYVVTHQDITPLISAVGNGNYNTFTGLYIAANQELEVTMNADFTSADVGKMVVFRSATVTYAGRIAAVNEVNQAILCGANLPGSDVNTVEQVMVLDIDPDTNDLKLNAYWFGEIIDRIIHYAMADAKNTVLK